MFKLRESIVSVLNALPSPFHLVPTTGYMLAIKCAVCLGSYYYITCMELEWVKKFLYNLNLSWVFCYIVGVLI